MTDEVLVETRGRLGLLTLNRPKALNALDLAMAEKLLAALDDWALDERIAAVAIRGAGGRAFCAGGDVRALGALPDPAERLALARRYFRAEYTLNHRIHTFPKPYIALIDGIAMGGGMGLSIHGSHRVVTERALLAMPETVLGLFPDVGASWYLNTCPGEMGVYLGLTGQRLDAADALALGLCDHGVASADLDGLIDALAAEATLAPADIDRLLGTRRSALGQSALAARQDAVDRLFAGASVEGIAAALAAAPQDWAAEALGVIRRAAPTSLKITLRRLREGRGETIAQILEIDYRLACRLAAAADLAEGVRAILIDKDHAPRWRPDRLETVDAAALDHLLRPFDDPGEELSL